MRKYLALIIGLLGLMGAQTALPAPEAPKRVFIVPIRQEVGEPLVYIVRRGVKEAMDAHATLLVIDMDTYGGKGSSMEEIIDIINQFKGETVSFVNTKAFSAGALICFATHQIYMAPQSVIGAAAPVQMAPGGSGIESLPDTVEVKMASAVSAMVRANAEKNGHNVDVADAMVKKTKELTLDGKVINEKGQILTLTDKEALAKYGKPPKPLLSAGTADSLDALLDQLGYGAAERTVIKPSGAETLAAFLNTISPVLLIVGIIGLYIEVKTPGVVVPAVISVIAFLLYFLGGYVAGLSGMEWVIVFIIGLGLVISEFFVHPGTIFPGLIGAALVLVALIMAMADMYPGPLSLPTFPQVELPLKNLGIALAGSLLIVAALARFLPKTPVYRTLVSRTASGDASVLAQQHQQSSRIGQTGIAISNLRPGGKARFGDDILDVVTQGEMIAKDQPVRIIAYTGSDAIVESQKPA